MYILCLVEAGKKKEEEEEENIGDYIATIIDMFNLFAFILGGGPQEVILRVTLLLFTTLVLIIISNILVLCLNFINRNYNRNHNYNRDYYYYRDYYHNNNRNIDIFNFFEWVFRLIGLYYFSGELYTNRNRWI